MKTQRLTLMDFGTVPEPFAPMQEQDAEQGLSAAEAEAIRVEAYEKGYKSGWDDAVGTAEKEQRAIGEELSRNLRDLGFTYFEAREEILGGLRAFLEELLESLFPALMAETVLAATAEHLSDIAEPLMAGEFTLFVSPDDAGPIRALLPIPGHADLEIREEPALAPGQAQLKTASREVTIDAERIVARLREALTMQSHQDEEAQVHG